MLSFDYPPSCLADTLSASPLPKLSEPKYFFEVHHITDKVLTDDEIYYYGRLKTPEPFNYLTICGDKFLGLKIQHILTEFFGVDNLSLVNLLYARTVSNQTFKDLAITYRLDQCVGVERATYDKFWADLWEAYWGALFLERQLWNEGDEDLVRFIREMVFLRNEKVIQALGAYPFFAFDPTMQTDYPDSQDDIDVQEVATIDGIKHSGQNPPNLGYQAKYKSTTNHHQRHINASFFSRTREMAISKLIWYHAVPWSMLTSCSPFPSLL
jgi:hypothetical protein